MNGEMELKLQAYLDGELPARQAAQVEECLSGDSDLARTREELNWVRAMLRKEEPARCVPESREFYWSKIARQIEVEERVAARERSFRPAWLEILPWRRILASAGGMAAAAFLMLACVKFFTWETADRYPRHLAQVENLSDEMGAFTFRSQSENVFVLWLYERSPESSADTALLNQMMLQ